MEHQFYCNDCDKIFTAEPGRKEYVDPVYGPCMSITATCPDCNAECAEYRKPKPKTEKKAPQIPQCGSGTCCPYN